MIRVVSLEVENFRGLRQTRLEFGGDSAVIVGPNGSGKSGVVDAIEFGLTGSVSRLRGAGTGSVSIRDHAPHVDARDQPEFSTVSLEIRRPSGGVTAVLRRSVTTPGEFALDPDVPYLRGAIERISKHPEIILSRREILRYILARPNERAKRVQALLRVEKCEVVRSRFKSAVGKLGGELSQAERLERAAKTALEGHFNGQVTKERVLGEVNVRRTKLGLQPLEVLTAETALDVGLEDVNARDVLDKQSALNDVTGLREGLAALEQEIGVEWTEINGGLGQLASDRSLLDSIGRGKFIRAGIDLVSGPLCPLCEADWEDESKLRHRLLTFQERQKRGVALEKTVLRAGEKVKDTIVPLGVLAKAVTEHARLMKDSPMMALLGTTRDTLRSMIRSLKSLADLMKVPDTFSRTPSEALLPSGLRESLAALEEAIRAAPDEHTPAVLQKFLVVAQERIEALRHARRELETKRRLYDLATTVHATYESTRDSQLEALYDEVRDEFSSYYRKVNSDDEGQFKAEITASGAALDLHVDFHGRGVFPPGAYHSEGHQDGMGICLSLALMRRTWGSDFSLALWDDVLMSIDAAHRKRFSDLLKEEFPSTQFIVTTHDRVWAKQLQSSSFVRAANVIEFRGWTVVDGPRTRRSPSDIWGDVDGELERGDVPGAAHSLRRFVEYAATELAESIGAKVRYRSDAGYGAGELLSAVIGRYGELLKRAQRAAKKWKNEDSEHRIEEERRLWQEVLKRHGREAWTVNVAVHHNEWATLTPAEMRETVQAFRELFEMLKCGEAGCGSWLMIEPAYGTPTALRCKCGSVSWNLRDA